MFGRFLSFLLWDIQLSETLRTAPAGSCEIMRARARAPAQIALARRHPVLLQKKNTLPSPQGKPISAPIRRPEDSALTGCKIKKAKKEANAVSSVTPVPSKTENEKTRAYLYYLGLG